MTRTAVAVSPHLDDAVFSVGGVLALLASAGWSVRVVTCFTASVAAPTGFALSTQLDKGLPADVDYMALRRAEDLAAAEDLGVVPVHLPLTEAPHRGYDSAAELFAGLHPDDGVGAELGPLLTPEIEGADLVLAPQALGNHVDHEIVRAVVATLVSRECAAWWRDVPYVRRDPSAGSADLRVGLSPVLDQKVRAARRYATQNGFQFGGDAHVGPALTEIARSEGDGRPVEALIAGDVLRSAMRHR